MDSEKLYEKFMNAIIIAKHVQLQIIQFVLVALMVYLIFFTCISFFLLTYRILKKIKNSKNDITK